MKNEYKETSNADTCGSQALCFAIIEQAVVDAKALIDNGIIRNGKCHYSTWTKKVSTGAGEDDYVFDTLTDWPKGLRVVGYKTVAEVEELIYFFESTGCKNLLTISGSSINVDAIRKELGLKALEGIE